MPKRAPTTLIIDADMLIYEAAANSESAVEWAPGEYTLDANLSVAISKLYDRVEALRETYSADSAVLCVNDDINFRHSVYPDYKGNRVSVRKPLLIKPMRDYLADEQSDFKSFRRDGLEADDVVGIIATHPTLVPGRKIVFSGDKDLKQIPGEHARPDGKVITISETDADLFFFTQVLTGDTTDGYPGCPGVGPKKAEALLDPQPYEVGSGPRGAVTQWRTIVDAYMRAGLTAQHALIQARCARILRSDDYDFKTKKVKLWTPPAI